ncbi:MAG TPA: IS110 family transposase [Gaiellaceae bacterium]|nr:IS110 family transposase [Gaiellaceae bacterium]
MSWTVAIGIDTHRDRHSACALDPLGRPRGELELSADRSGYESLWRWACSLGEPAFALEGSGSYGAGLARHLSERAARVYECERPTRRDRRRGKSDRTDAAAAARRLVAGDGLSALRGFGDREQLRVLLVERRSARSAQSAALNQLHARDHGAALAAGRLEGLRGLPLARRAARLRSTERCLPAPRRVAGRALALAEEIELVDGELARLVAASAPALLDECGVGPVCAAQLLVSAGDPARMRSEAAFAALAGTSPVDASSGRQRRHRLHRGGDRQLNSALHVIALNRKRAHGASRVYYERLLASGKTKREAMRCLKRMLARYFYGRLHAPGTGGLAEAAP